MDTAVKTPEEQLREAREEIARLRIAAGHAETLFEFLPLPVAVASDRDAGSIRINRAMAEILGVDGREMAVPSTTGRAPYRVLRDNQEVEAFDLPLQRVCRLGEDGEGEFEIERADGTRLPVFWRAKPCLDEAGMVCGGVATYADLSDRRLASVVLEQAVEKARAAHEELQQFTYAASHDLQEPLRSIAAYAQLLQRHSSSNAEVDEFTNFIVDGVNRMNVLIRDLLTYSRTTTSPNRSMIKLNALLQWSLLNLERLVREAGAQVKVGDLPEAFVDEGQVVQLFQNLLSNSLKYRGTDPPEIEVSAEETNAEYIISVTDNGVGIDPRFHQQVFGVFKRLHGRDIPGTGIGLALSRKIVEAHGGKIWVESDGKRGSTFRFSLPI